MEFLLSLITKVFVFALFMAMLNVIKHTYLFIHAMVNSNDDVKVKYTPTTTQTIVLAVSISYILTIIFTGFF